MAVDSMAVLTELSRAQWGMFTAAQARGRGVSRATLARLADRGVLERETHGVYRVAGGSGDERDALRAAWLGIRPHVMAEERLRWRSAGPIVAGATAAWLHGLGTLQPEPYEFSAPDRIQSRRLDVRFHRRPLDDDAVTIISGLPACSVGQTIADLVAWNTDLSLVGEVIADAVTAGTLEPDDTARRLAPLAGRQGLPPGDGVALLERLLRIGGVDLAAIARRTAAGPLGPLVVSAFNDAALRDLRAGIARMAYPAPAEQVEALSRAMEPLLSAQRAIADMKIRIDGPTMEVEIARLMGGAFADATSRALADLGAIDLVPLLEAVAAMVGRSTALDVSTSTRTEPHAE
jgi:hypothetical protein